MPNQETGILVEEQFGAAILRDVAGKPVVTACPERTVGRASSPSSTASASRAISKPSTRPSEKVLIRYNPGRSRVSTGARIARWSWPQLETGGRDDVGCIVLGRGEDDRTVRDWPGTTAELPGFIGVAVGRTVFWSPLVARRTEKATRDQAVAEIARRYRELVDLFKAAHICPWPAATGSDRSAHRCSRRGADGSDKW